MISSISAMTIVAMCALSIAGGGSPGQDAADYEKTIQEWIQGRVDRLTSETGYLSLVGLYALSPGRNEFGSAKSNDLVFPEEAPAFAGTITLADDEVKIRPVNDVKLFLGDEPVRGTVTLEKDEEGAYPVVSMGDFSFFVIERGGDRYLRVRNPNSEYRRQFAGIERFPIDPRWRIEAHFESYNPPKTIRVASVLGYETEALCRGAIVFEIDGETYRLEPVEEVGDEFFVVFGDETTGIETYGGGRYVYCKRPDEDGKMIIDFNKAYNPPCAFTPHTTCTLPHRENLLPIRVEAGEKTYAYKVQ